jgi:hypothetical protein
MPTLEEVLRQKAVTSVSSSKYMKLEDIPKEIKMKWLKDELKQDTNKKDCLFVTFETESGLLIVQKYTGTMFSTLADAIKGREKDLKETFYLYEHVDVPTFRGKTGFPRLYPVSQETRKKAK